MDYEFKRNQSQLIFSIFFYIITLIFSTVSITFYQLFMLVIDGFCEQNPIEYQSSKNEN